MPTAGPFVASIEWVAANRDSLRIVDVRDEWEYDGIGHIPGAVNIPFDQFRNAGNDAGMLPGVDRFCDLMTTTGITRDDTIVAYDDEHGVFAARFLVTAMMYGHPDWRLLDGDYSAWSRAEPTTTDPPAVTPSEYQASIPADRPLIDADAVLEASRDPDAVLVDTRTHAEFTDGHIAGAVNFDWRELVDPESRGLKSEDELREFLAGYDIVPEKQIVLYCNTARRISHTYIVLRHLGYTDVKFYEGSLTDWNERGLDLETGPG